MNGLLYFSGGEYFCKGVPLAGRPGLGLKQTAHGKRWSKTEEKVKVIPVGEIELSPETKAVKGLAEKYGFKKSEIQSGYVKRITTDKDGHFKQLRIVGLPGKTFYASGSFSYDTPLNKNQSTGGDWRFKDIVEMENFVKKYFKDSEKETFKELGILSHDVVDKSLRKGVQLRGRAGLQLQQTTAGRRWKKVGWKGAKMSDIKEEVQLKVPADIKVDSSKTSTKKVAGKSVIMSATNKEGIYFVSGTGPKGEFEQVHKIFGNVQKLGRMAQLKLEPIEGGKEKITAYFKPRGVWE